MASTADRDQTNSADPDRTLQNATSDLSLHCLPKSIVWNIGYELVNQSLRGGVKGETVTSLDKNI